MVSDFGKAVVGRVRDLECDGWCVERTMYRLLMPAVTARAMVQAVSLRPLIAEASVR